MGTRLKSSTVFWIFIWCIFMGITVGSIGLGAVFPYVNRITKPFVCRAGQLELVTQDYHPSPVETVTTLTWYCTDPANGARHEVNMFQMALIAGPLYGLVLFFVVMEVMWIRSNRHVSAADTESPSSVWSPPASDNRESHSSVEERLAELKNLRDTGLITEQDYARKKSAILNDL